MTLYAPHPRMEVRECEQHFVCGRCITCRCCRHCPEGRGYVVGRLLHTVEQVAGRPDRGAIRFVPAPSQDVIEVYQNSSGGWLASIVKPNASIDGREVLFPVDVELTAPEAIRAVRCAYWGVRLNHTTMFTGAPAWGYLLTDGGYCFGPYPTPDDALVAAIDAKEK